MRNSPTLAATRPAKPTGATCNLDCKHCFFLFKEMLYPCSRFCMADEMLQLYIKQLIESYSAMSGKPTTFQFIPIIKRATPEP